MNLEDTILSFSLFDCISKDIYFYNIFNYLSFIDLKSFRIVCKKFYYIVNKHWKPWFTILNEEQFKTYNDNNPNFLKQIYGINFSQNYKYVANDDDNEPKFSKVFEYGMNNLTNLKYLDFRGQIIDNDIVFPNVLVFHQITYLNLSKCVLTDIFFENNTIPPMLTHLDLSYTKITVNTIKKLPSSILTLNLYCCYGLVTDNFIIHLPRKIQKIDLSYIDLSFNYLNYLPPTLQSLTFIILHYTEHIDIPSNITDIKITVLNNSSSFDLKDLPSNLVELTLSCEKIINSQCLKNFTSLTYLSLCNCNVKDSDLIGNLPLKLTHFELYKCKLITNKIIDALPPLLEVLNIIGCDQVYGDELFKKLPPTLKSIYCSNMTDKGLSVLPKKIEKLIIKSKDHIGFDSHFINNLISDQGLFEMNNNMFNIKVLSLYHINITDIGLNHIPHTVEKLHLSECNYITNKGLLNLPNKIVELSLFGNINIIFDESFLLNSVIKYLYLEIPVKYHKNDNNNYKVYIPPSIIFLRIIGFRIYPKLISDSISKLETLEITLIDPKVAVETILKGSLPKNLKRIKFNYKKNTDKNNKTIFQKFLNKRKNIDVIFDNFIYKPEWIY